MRINDQNLAGITSAPLGRTQDSEAASRSGRGGAAGTAGEDRVQLSNLADHLRALNPETPERAAYLEKLAAEVKAGRYAVDTQTVSRAIVDEALAKRD